MPEQLSTILERFKSKLSYREQDKRALDISRAANAGSLGESDYSEWALISNDPLVIINYVKTYITVQASKLAAAPFRPQDDVLNETAINMRLNSSFVELYQSTLADGYSFLGLGMDNGQPIHNIIDARSIMYNGNDPTLKDATEMVVFEVLPKSPDDNFISNFPSGYVEFDTESEKVRTYYYHKKDGQIFLDIYEEGKEEVSSNPIPNVDRIPVVRFFGEKFELNDKRYHYRGLYYQLSGVIKALALAATKVQIRTAMSDDNNYMASSDAISNHKTTWQNAGVREMDTFDANGDEIKNPVVPIPHDNQFLLSTVEMWKTVISDQLGPVVQSSSEAVTREEVLARNEVRDAIANTYLSNMADSVSEVYRIMQSMMTGNTAKVVVQGGLLESVQRQKMVQEITGVYNLAKESGLNAQGFIFEILANSELPLAMKNRVGQLLMQDPFAGPITKQLQTQLQQAQQTIQQQQTQITQLRLMATQRMERQAEWVASQERIKRFEIMFKQWQQENKDTQEARMEVLRKLLDAGDTYGAMAMLQAIQSIDSPVLATPATQYQMDDATKDTLGQYQQGELQNGAIPPSNTLGGVQNGPGPGPAPAANQPGANVIRYPQQVPSGPRLPFTPGPGGYGPKPGMGPTV